MLVVNEIIERQEGIDMLKSAHIYELAASGEARWRFKKKMVNLDKKF